MVKLSIIFILFFSMILHAKAKNNLRSYLFKQLPPKISKALQAKTKIDIEKIMGSPALAEESAIHYEEEGFKYALTVEIKNGKVEKIFYHPKSIKLSLRDFDENKVIDKTKIRPLKNNGGDDGSFSEYVDKKSHLRLVFDNSSGWILSTVEVLK